MEAWGGMKQMTRRKILLTDDIWARIPPSNPHGQRNAAEVEGPKWSQSGNKQRGDTDSAQKAHNTDLARERVAHLQGSLRNNSLYGLLIWRRFLHVFQFSGLRVFPENRSLEPHSDAFIFMLTHPTPIYNHMKARDPMSFYQVGFLFISDDDD